MSRLVCVVAVVAVLVVGCSGAPDPAPDLPSDVTPSSTSAVPSASGSAVPTTGPSSGVPLSTTGGVCPAVIWERITVGAVPKPVCVPVNGALRLTAAPSTQQPWGLLISSNPQALSCASEAAAEGAVNGVCTPHLAGTALVSTITAPVGTAQFRWVLQVTVVARGST